MKNIFKFITGLILLNSPLIGYNLPNSLNLGETNFLDGMPLPYGLNLIEYFDFFESHRFRDYRGQTLGHVPSPDFDPRVATTQFYYQTDWTLPTGAQIGLDVLIPYVFTTNLSTPNQLLFNTSGGGFADPLIGLAFQWQPTEIFGFTYAQRIEFVQILPIGKFHKHDVINPGSHYWSFIPYWAGTLFFTPKWEVSWRLHYLISSKNHDTGIRPGDAFFMNYSTSWEINETPNVRLGFGGYYLTQLQKSKLNGKYIEHDKEQVFSIGPIINWGFADGTQVNFACYIETNNKNRVQFDKFLFRIFHNFDFSSDCCCDDQ